MKPVKLYYNGKRLKDIYPHATTWQVIKFKVKRFTRKVLIMLTVLTVIAGTTAYIVHHYYPSMHYQIVDREIIIDNLSSKIDELKGGIIADIKTGETSDVADCEGLIVFDSNKVASIGCYQFQVKTIIAYEKKLHNRQVTKKDAILIATDNAKAGQLTREIIFSEKNGWKNWYNTGVKYKVESRLSLIATLSR